MDYELKMSKCFLRNNYPKTNNSNEVKLEEKLLQTQYILLITEVAQ